MRILLGALLSLFATAATPQSMQWAYSDNGLSFRVSPCGADLRSGEVCFSTTPTPAQLTSAFTGYAAAIAAQTAQAQIAAATAAGLAIVSTSTPALSGTYAIDAPTWQKAMAVSLYIQVNGKFPAGQTSLVWTDGFGSHTFTSPTQFQTVASTLADYVTAVNLGQTPAQPVTLP